VAALLVVFLALLVVLLALLLVSRLLEANAVRVKRRRADACMIT
jgi:hypothetical protein